MTDTITKPRPWASLSFQEQDKLARMYEAGESVEGEIDRLNLKMTPRSLERKLREFRYYRRLFLTEAAASVVLPESRNKPYRDYTILEADSAVVISDIEIPDQDARMLRAALLVAMRRGIKTLIYNGDVIATDQTALNSWVAEWRDEGDVSYRTALDDTRSLMVQYGKWFEHQYFVSGNHDNRIARKTGGEIHLEMLLRDTPTKFSRYKYMYLKTKRGWVYISHPKNYSIHAASKLGNDLWANTVAPDKSKCHIVLGHTHLAQTAWSPDGQQQLVSTGCMRRQAQYADVEATSHRKWQRGFLVIDNGYFYPMTEFGTDWERELGDLYSTWESED